MSCSSSSSSPSSNKPDWATQGQLLKSENWKWTVKKDRKEPTYPINKPEASRDNLWEPLEEIVKGLEKKYGQQDDEVKKKVVEVLIRKLDEERSDHNKLMALAYGIAIDWISIQTEAKN